MKSKNYQSFVGVKVLIFLEFKFLETIEFRGFRG